MRKHGTLTYAPGSGTNLDADEANSETGNEDGIQRGSADVIGSRLDGVRTDELVTLEDGEFALFFCSTGDKSPLPFIMQMTRILKWLPTITGMTDGPQRIFSMTQKIVSLLLVPLHTFMSFDGQAFCV